MLAHFITIRMPKRSEPFHPQGRNVAFSLRSARLRNWAGRHNGCMRKVAKVGGGALLALGTLVALWLVPNPLTPCGNWRGDVIDLANDNNAVGREKTFTDLEEAGQYTDKLMQRAGKLGQQRPSLCPVPGSLNLEDSGVLYWLVVPEDATPEVFREEPDEGQRSRADAAKLTFQVYEPTWTPDGYSVESVQAVALPHLEQVSFTYEKGDDLAFGFQNPSYWKGNIAPSCDIPLAGLSSRDPQGPCEKVTSEGGREIFLTDLSVNSTGGRAAITVLGDTTTYIVYSNLSDKAAIRYLDSLQPVEPTDLQYFDNYQS